MSDKETLKVYAQKADEYAALTKRGADDHPILQRFLASVKPGGHILDLGCGPGLFAQAMARAGFTVTATDAVPQMVELVPKHPAITPLCARFDDIDQDAVFDGVWANFSLLHAPRADMPRTLKALRRALKPRGSLHIGLKAGEGEKRDAIGRLYTYYTDPELSGLLEDAGFQITHRETGCEKGLDGVMADWIVVQAHG